MKHVGLLVLGSFINSLGTGLSTFGLAVVILRAYGTASSVAAVQMSAFAPIVLLAPLAGVLADRYDRRLMMMIGDAGSILGLGVILTALSSPRPSLGWICAGAVISSCLAALTEPALRASVSDLVDVVERMTSDSVAQHRDVAWVERPRMGTEPPRLTLAPIDVAGPVADALFDERVAVLTSATLALGGGFEPMARDLGLTLAEAPWEGVDVGTPFDYARQGILYTPVHLPRPGRGISEAALDEVLALTEASRGGMLGLFSSRRAAEEAAGVLRGATDLTVYAQGEDQLPALVEAFAADEDSCLVGTLSLWQGVDVPGRTCRLVIIDRIPFPRPDDPVAQARSEAVATAGGNGFMSVAATHAALLLAQGAGRLIRRAEDRGVVAVLDPRLRTARYGAFLARSMPPLWPTRDRDVVLGALGRLAAM